VRIVNGQPVYYRHDWQSDHVDLPPNEQLIIYELHIGDFRGGPGDDLPTPGTFARVIDKLDYLVELGINAIELMPVTQAQPDDNWGYSQHSLYAVDHALGTPDELAQLVDACHKRGIRVIHDGVFNHLNGDAPLAQIDYSYWFYETNPDKPELHFGPKFNFQFRDKDLGVYPAREHVLGAIHRWIGNFHMDGVRFDSTRALKHLNVIRWFNEEAYRRSGFKPFFTIAEHLPQDPKITVPHGPVDAAWHDNSYRQLNCTVLGVPVDGREPFDTTGLLRALNARNDGFASNHNTIRYLNNHDQERTMYRLGDTSGLSGEVTFRRNKLGISLLLTAPGIPMLWMGEEFGQDTPRGKNTEQKPLDWSLLDKDPNRDLWRHYQTLIQLRKTSPALCSDNFEVVADLPDQNVIAFKRWDDGGQVILVVANLVDNDAGDVEIIHDAIPDGDWREVIGRYTVKTDRHRLIDRLGKSQVKVYINNQST
jgi:1,4-alpha-glucan branching enzyme